MTILIQQLTFHCRWTTDGRLPDYPGSTLRGAFGWALKRCTCMLKQQKCLTCVLNSTCAYSLLFATEQYNDNEVRGPVNARPHPLVFQPRPQRTGLSKKGESWDFSLLIIGHTSEFQPHIVYSVKMMGETGIGVGAKHGLGRFTLEKVTSNDVTVFDDATGQLDNTTVAESLVLQSTAEDVGQLRIHLRTPLRLKQENKLLRELPFHVLVRTALRRISALEIAYGLDNRGEPDLDYRGLVHRAKGVEVKESSLRWRELRRYSNRQQQKVSLSGLTGTALYEGELGEFVPLLQYAQRVHVGKQTLFGLGSIEIEPFNHATRWP
ncbi:CRISPR system precrRNA processing endoribonuclease RAMP protein Cas6 [Desulfobulbus alkaliphilus]|uniref:CRISPR system precrRNA processing endoribonuclease RAMP protein Cas6 n=1 Tax=Desulfobulbus alkaliphilus TaxID=869814 RepID=UPI0019635A8B|nr:CRISPR system precrRNA processing endoribonuclease RAMP protein Cas6 [Desulfobulbus alkaliphilus]MBM9536297.1 CRISPR system precrRNA processing endoribonuclease RAMP protein Cas6 [Desulfobulbus alkaliphilus]